MSRLQPDGLGRGLTAGREKGKGRWLGKFPTCGPVGEEGEKKKHKELWLFGSAVRILSSSWCWFCAHLPLSSPNKAPQTWPVAWPSFLRSFIHSTDMCVCVCVCVCKCKAQLCVPVCSRVGWVLLGWVGLVRRCGFLFSLCQLCASLTFFFFFF